MTTLEELREAMDLALIGGPVTLTFTRDKDDNIKVEWT